MAAQMQSAPTIIRRKQVEARTGLPCSTIYERMAAGEFPRPVRVGARSVGWIETEISEWIAGRIAASRKAA
jgi:prophage regulatory protein